MPRETRTDPGYTCRGIALALLKTYVLSFTYFCLVCSCVECRCPLCIFYITERPLRCEHPLIWAFWSWSQDIHISKVSLYYFLHISIFVCSCVGCRRFPDPRRQRSHQENDSQGRHGMEHKVGSGEIRDIVIDISLTLWKALLGSQYRIDIGLPSAHPIHSLVLTVWYWTLNNEHQYCPVQQTNWPIHSVIQNGADDKV